MSTSGTYVTDASDENRFAWKSFPKTQHLLEDHLTTLLRKPQTHQPLLQEIQTFAQEAQTLGLRFMDLIDYVHLALPKNHLSLLKQEGFQLEKAPQNVGWVYRHPEALFPTLLLEKVDTEKASGLLEMGIKTEDLDHLKAQRKYSETIQGEKESSVRKLSLKQASGPLVFSFIERQGSTDFHIGIASPDFSETVKQVRDLLRHREEKVRGLEDTERLFQETAHLVQEMVSLVGPTRAAHEWVQSEVRYWERHNHAGHTQGEAQRQLGVGWANKDHITYRNSKKNFPKTLEILSALGFVKREKLHAEEFTAQVMEHPVLGISAFVDVDPPEKKGLGTVGLWIEVHGESMGPAGLHHLAARFNFAKAQEALRKKGVLFRPPFSNFDDLKQAFTEGEKRKISETRIQKLLSEQKIDPSQAEEYTKVGAVYSHLENIERGNGFKGFNPQSVDKTLRDTGRSLRAKGSS